jgi:nucleoside-diphosphate-sugar epimerase
MLKQGTAKYITRHKRDWVHVLDVVRAIATLIPTTYTGTIDVGTGQMTSVIDLANAMGMGHLPIKEDTPNEPDELCANIEPLMELGWFPTVNILDTVIAKTVSV